MFSSKILMLSKGPEFNKISFHGTTLERKNLKMNFLVSISFSFILFTFKRVLILGKKLL